MVYNTIKVAMHTSLFISSIILGSIPFNLSSVISSVSVDELFLDLDMTGLLLSRLVW